MSYRQDILKAVLDIHAVETERGKWVTKDSKGLYKTSPPTWTSPGSRLVLDRAIMAFAAQAEPGTTRLVAPLYVNQVKIILPLIDVDMFVRRTGEDYYQDSFTRDIVLPHVLAVRALCVHNAESQGNAA